MVATLLPQRQGTKWVSIAERQYVVESLVRRLESRIERWNTRRDPRVSTTSVEEIFSDSLRPEHFMLKLIHSYDKYHNTISTFKRIDDAKTIASHDESQGICHRHVDQRISRMTYLVHSNEATERHQLWNSLAPGEFGDNEKESFTGPSRPFNGENGLPTRFRVYPTFYHTHLKCKVRYLV